MKHNSSDVLLRRRKNWQIAYLQRTKQLGAQHTFSALQRCWLKRLREALQISRGGGGEGARRRGRAEGDEKFTRGLPNSELAGQQ